MLDAESQAVEPFLKCSHTGISSRAHFQCRCQFLRMSHWPERDGATQGALPSPCCSVSLMSLGGAKYPLDEDSSVTKF